MFVQDGAYLLGVRYLLLQCRVGLGDWIRFGFDDMLQFAKNPPLPKLFFFNFNLKYGKLRCVFIRYIGVMFAEFIQY